MEPSSLNLAAGFQRGDERKWTSRLFPWPVVARAMKRPAASENIKWKEGVMRDTITLALSLPKCSLGEIMGERIQMSTSRPQALEPYLLNPSDQPPASLN